MTPTMPPDSHKISLKIIEAIKQHPVLYINDVKGTTVKVQEFRQKVWKRISDELSLDPVWVRLKWKNLRDTYCRILKYKNKTDKGGRRKKWIFEDHLNFLKFPYESDYQPLCVELTEEYIQEINDGGISSEGLLEQLEDRTDEDYSEYLEVLEETTADPVLSDAITTNPSPSSDTGQPRITDRLSEIIPVNHQHDNYDNHEQEIENYAQQIQSKYRKIRPKRMKIEPSNEISNDHSLANNSVFDSSRKPERSNNLSNDAKSVRPIIITAPSILPIASSIGIPKNSSQKSSPTVDVSRDVVNSHPRTSVELFFNSMAQTVKRLPLKAQVDIKMAVCRIVTEAEVRYSRHAAESKNTQRFIAPPGMIPKLVLVPCSMIDDPGNRG